MVMLLGSLAHNILVWSRRWLSADAPRLAKYGALRMVRDLFHINGLLEFGPGGALLRITLNQAAPHVREIALALSKLISGTKVEYVAREGTSRCSSSILPNPRLIVFAGILMFRHQCISPSATMGKRSKTSMIPSTALIGFGSVERGCPATLEARYPPTIRVMLKLNLETILIIELTSDLDISFLRLFLSHLFPFRS
jgi:hypothetical protein